MDASCFSDRRSTGISGTQFPRGYARNYIEPRREPIYVHNSITYGRQHREEEERLLRENEERKERERRRQREREETERQRKREEEARRREEEALARHEEAKRVHGAMLQRHYRSNSLEKIIPSAPPAIDYGNQDVLDELYAACLVPPKPDQSEGDAIIA